MKVASRSIEFAEYPVLKGFDGGGNIKSVVLSPYGILAKNTIQVVTLKNDPVSGNFTLTVLGEETGNIAYNADGAAVDTALTATTVVGATDVTVTGAAGGPWTVEFTDSLGSQPVADMTADASGLVQDPNGFLPEVQVETVQLGRAADSADATGRYTYYEGTILTVDPNDTDKVKQYEGAGGEEIIGVLAIRRELYGAGPSGASGDDFARPAPCLYHNCVFDKSKIIDFVTHESALRTALPTCRFE